MLVLTRRVGEEIVIDGNIRITVVDVSGERARLGVSAPPSIRVDRLEIYHRRARSQAGAREAPAHPICQGRD